MNTEQRVDESQAMTIVDPQTAEILVLREASVDQLAMTISNVRELERNLKAMKGVINEEVHRRMDEQRHWTLDGTRYRLSSGSPEPAVTYNADDLDAVLAAWVNAGQDPETRILRQEARERAIRVEVTHVAKIGGVKAILKGADEQLRGRIEACKVLDAKARYPKVELR